MMHPSRTPLRVVARVAAHRVAVIRRLVQELVAEEGPWQQLVLITGRPYSIS